MTISTIEPTLLGKIRAARALPSPPAVTARLIELGEDPNVGLDQIIDVLQTDAALCARLLRLANSPLYARRRRTENIRQAVTLLGVDAVLTAALSLTMLATANGPSSMPAAFNRDRWKRSVHAAVCCQTLAHVTRTAVPGDAFLGGLLQDVGVQVVLRVDAETYRGLAGDCSHDDLVAAEIAHLGADHAAIGAALLEGWRLPDKIVDSVATSHDESLADAAPALARLVMVGGIMADAVGGDLDALQRAAALAASRLDLDAEAFAGALEQAGEALPDLAPILNAEPPDPTLIAEMAEEVLLQRMLSTQMATDELNDRLVHMTHVAETLQVDSQLDPLTGLSNRRHLDQVLQAEHRLSAEHGFPLSLLFVDLDDFKQVNDRYGHRVGDDLLVQSARRISRCIRDGDVVGRYGGEEFLVVLSGADIASSDSAADRLVRAFDDRSFDLGSELELHQTISIGVATLEDAAACADLGDLVHAADVALYAAKRSGKNRWRRCASSIVTDSPGRSPAASNGVR